MTLPRSIRSSVAPGLTRSALRASMTVPTLGQAQQMLSRSNQLPPTWEQAEAFFRTQSRYLRTLRGPGDERSVLLADGAAPQTPFERLGVLIQGCPLPKKRTLVLTASYVPLSLYRHAAERLTERAGDAGPPLEAHLRHRRRYWSPKRGTR